MRIPCKHWSTKRHQRRKACDHAKHAVPESDARQNADTNGTLRCHVHGLHHVDVDRGSGERATRRNFAIANCATCHSIDRYTPSPLPIAPAFRDLHLRYKVETLEEALAEGLVTGHMNMPEFRLEPDQISDFISFLKNFER